MEAGGKEQLLKKHVRENVTNLAVAKYCKLCQETNELSYWDI